jgi:hypothetical protein
MAAPMDERINVPIDDPNADTEWYLTLIFVQIACDINIKSGMIFCGNMVLSLKNPLRRLLSSKKLFSKDAALRMKID